jgi:predicted MFS family arabinose efflux permease
VRIAARIGLVNTMVFTHLPANVCLVLVPFAPGLGTAIALLLIRSLLSQMDVPTRTSYVMAVVTPGERAAAASITAVPRSLASALGPVLAGHLLAASGFGWPLVLGGGLKIAYDLTLLALFRNVRPPEERERPSGTEQTAPVGEATGVRSRACQEPVARAKDDGGSSRGGEPVDRHADGKPS